MPQISHSIPSIAKKQERFISKPNPYQLARLFAPYLFAMAFATAAQAQGTMDFSGAQTLMGTFKTFAMYAGTVICTGGLALHQALPKLDERHGRRTYVLLFQGNEQETHAYMSRIGISI